HPPLDGTPPSVCLGVGGSIAPTGSGVKGDTPRLGRPARYSRADGDGRSGMQTLTMVCRGIGAALRARGGSAAVAVIVVLALEILAPALVLSVARKPWTYFTFNPWLKRLPEYLAGSAPF